MTDRETALQNPAAYEPATFVTGQVFGDRPTRSSLLEKKRRIRTERHTAGQDARLEPKDSPERTRLFRVVQDLQLEEDRLEEALQTRFVPQHAGHQLISPRAFFISPLFRVCSKTVERAPEVTVQMTTQTQGVVLHYVGPELRQSDGLVFMALLNLARDAQVGCVVSFSPEKMCEAVMGRYDGPARKRLKEHIKRLQRGLVEFAGMSVQLCQKFEFPTKGEWTVALDADIVALFGHSAHVWLDAARRLALPEGLATWLYAFIESQSRLIPTSVETLRQLCGSDASADSFLRVLRRALGDLAEHGVIESGWKVEAGRVRWMKREPGPSTGVPGEPHLLM